MTIIGWLSRGGRLVFGIAVGAIAVLFNPAIGLVQGISLSSAPGLLEEEEKNFTLYGFDALGGVVSGMARSLQQTQVSTTLLGTRIL